ncbi:HNH endonuclease signature motif containing protein [Microbacterium hydrothermale]|uniref:HNH endonuclease signature motif containing protein n=1 Tax=Microbacterium hydrothermale TaxID=857427 RepID=UPI0010A7E31D|nr:HNH endonuclease signature motif containing protein [Microbacterium hydrothermale]
MDAAAPLTDRPSPAVRACDGVPWPADEELDDEAAWARLLDLGAAGHADDPFAAAEHFADDPGTPFDGASVSVSDLDAVLGHLELIAAERRRLAAEEGRLIATVLRDAAADPTPWVGPDPTLDPAWDDSRGRTLGAVRRDRIDLAQRAAAAEMAVRLRLSEQTIRTRAAHAEVLQERCPRLWAEFANGNTSDRHAVEVARLATTLPHDDTAWSAFDDGVTDTATTLTPTKFAIAARALRERVHAESIDARHRRAARDRGVWMTPELDGMASLNALLPAERARSILARLDRAARHLRAAPDEERTLAQLRADVLADLATAPAPGAAMTDVPPTPASRGESAGDPSSPPAQPREAARRDEPAPAAARTSPSAPTVVVTIPVLTLLGAGHDPATLEGYGPIDLDTARRLAGEARSWIRLLTHPVTGAPLVLDRQTYRVPAALRRWLGVTSPTCIFPGCNRVARDCDLDHLTAWADGGATNADNLAPECRHHHRLRHETGWTPAVDPVTGDVRWTSPLGSTYDTDPPPF